MQKNEVVLITGSSGLIGKELTMTLVKNYHLVGLDKKGPEEKIPGFYHHDVDITSEEDLSKVLQQIKDKFGPKIHSVIHLAAFYDFRGQEDERYQTITINGTTFLLKELKKLFEVEQFVFSSSLLVYAPVEMGMKIKENSPLAPSWPYPHSKVEAEEVLRQKHGDIPVVNVRMAGVYDEFCHSPTISQQIIRIHETWPTSLFFPGDPRAGQSFLHLNDLKEAMALIVKRRKGFAPYELFVLGEEKVVSYGELQRILGNLLHLRPWPTFKIPQSLAKVGAQVMQHLPFIREPFIKPWMVSRAAEHYDVDIGKIKQALSWEPKENLASSLPIMIENLKKQPGKWYSTNKVKKPFYRDLQEIDGMGERNMIFASIFNIFLGLWLMANPITFGQLERGEYFSQQLTGLLVLVLGALSVLPTIRWLRWINALLGSWLLFSPLVFHTESAAAYSNDTLIGGLIMLASVYTPSRSKDMAAPPGWTYNPSTAGQRLPIMLLAFLGFLMSRYLASFQLGHVANAWDPFFGNATETVLTSKISRAFPISDAGLGALTYLLDVIAASIGGRDRWRSMPWAVILFGLMIIPTGVTSIALVMLQPIGVGAWCTLCLITAVIMLMMVPPAVDEVLASVQFLIRKKKDGEAFWKVFFLGGEVTQKEEVPRMKPEGNLIHLYLCVLLSVFTMFFPWVLKMEGLAASSTYIVASLITTFSVIALSEVARLVRLLNVPLGLWLALSGWFFEGMNESAKWSSVIVGVIIIVLSLPRGKKQEAFGNMDHLIHWSPRR